jgi:hypothetical protein
VNPKKKVEILGILEEGSYRLKSERIRVGAWILVWLKVGRICVAGKLRLNVGEFTQQNDI